MELTRREIPSTMAEMWSGVRELGLDPMSLTSWFAAEPRDSYTFVTLTESQETAWAEKLGVAVQRCYFPDDLLEVRSKRLGISKAEVIKSLLPDPGSTMSGDFGEILTYIYQSIKSLPQKAEGVKKWRLKQDRTKPAPYSDVVHFILPKWPKSSSEDQLLCSEVKTKATDGDSNPVEKAIADSIKDKTGRLAKTLIWLKERAIRGDIADSEISKINRFLHAAEAPAATKRFYAVAVVCDDLVSQELTNVPNGLPRDYALIVIAVPALKAKYTAVFGAAAKAK